MKSSAVGAGCLVLFALPFAAGGLFGLSLLLAAVQRGDPAGRILLIASVAIPFCLVGFGMMFAAAGGRRRKREDEELRAQHPDSPWLWNRDWASRRIGDDSRTAMVSLWGFAILWNIISSPLLFFIPEQLSKGKELILIVLLFPLVGVMLLIGAARATMRVIRFRRSVLHLDTLPAPIGGTLRGRVEVPYPLTRASSIVVRLISTVTVPSGKGTETSIEWQDEVEVVPASLGQTGAGVTIPVEIGIPSNAAPADPPDSSGRVTREWRLTVDAELPGIDYSVIFPVPVFRTAFSEVRPPRTLHTPVAEPRQPRSCRVQHTAQGVEIHFPPRRAPSVAMAASGVAVIASGLVYVLLRGGLPLIFPIVLALFAAVVTWIALQLLFGSTTIVVTHDTVTIRNRMLSWRSEKRLARDDIASVDLKVTTQQVGARVMPFYEVLVRPTTGRRVTAANYIGSKREAEWVAAQIRRR